MTWFSRLAERPGGGIRALGAVPLLLLLTGCGDIWFGGAEAPPLPGERISILQVDRGISADPALADRPIRLPRPYVNRDWPQRGGHSTHAMYHLAVARDPRPAWDADIGEGRESDGAALAQPVVARGLVFVMDAVGRVSAFNERSGARVWSVNVTPEAEDDSSVGGGIAYDRGVLLVSTGFAEVIALRADNGRLLWRSRAPAPIRGAPTVVADRVMVITLDNQTVAFALRDGRLIWRHESGAQAAALLGGASPAATDQVAVVPYSSGEIYGLRVQDGLVLWNESAVTIRRTEAISSIADIRASPVIDRDTVFVLGHGDLFLGIDLATGARLWDRPIGGVNRPWAGGDFLFALSNDMDVVALERSSGRVRWVRRLPRYEDEEDREDPIQWVGPLLASDRLLMASSTGEIWALSPTDGSLTGALEVDAPMHTPITVANGSLYVLTDDGELLAYR